LCKEYTNLDGILGEMEKGVGLDVALRVFPGGCNTVYAKYLRGLRYAPGDLWKQDKAGVIGATLLKAFATMPSTKYSRSRAVSLIAKAGVAVLSLKAGHIEAKNRPGIVTLISQIGPKNVLDFLFLCA
jgi:hypothetical protein